MFGKICQWNPLQYSSLENPMNREAWWPNVCIVTVRHDWSDLAYTQASETIQDRGFLFKKVFKLRIKFL